eukprot:scaffold7759_cov119-Isochrysis_galbana.AAC.4
MSPIAGIIFPHLISRSVRRGTGAEEGAIGAPALIRPHDDTGAQLFRARLGHRGIAGARNFLRGPCSPPVGRRTWR